MTENVSSIDAYLKEKNTRKLWYNWSFWIPVCIWAPFSYDSIVLYVSQNSNPSNQNSISRFIFFLHIKIRDPNGMIFTACLLTMGLRAIHSFSDVNFCWKCIISFKTFFLYNMAWNFRLFSIKLHFCLHNDHVDDGRIKKWLWNVFL